MIALEQFVANVNTIVGIISVISLFLVSGILLFSKTRKGVSEASNKADDRLIGLLQGQVNALEKKVTEQAALIQENSLRLEVLMSENKTLKEIFQGRDEATQKFQKLGFETMNEVVPLLVKTTNETNKNVEKLYKAIEKHLMVMENTSKPETVVTVK